MADEINNEELNEQEQQPIEEAGENGQVDKNVHPIETGVDGLYKSWFLEYASYVILERAIPDNQDGLKPVQRRILHAMREQHDGRFHKVANLIGQTMQYHPHGDAAIGAALVAIGQKDLMIETQGNWGDIRTGDRAAAARYIEARLSKFAVEVGFNNDTTEWQLSYDGRKKEPVHLPMKFPLLLAQGSEGIAVGLSTKVMPHNFNELIDNSIKYLKGKKIEIFPDFLTGGMVDISNYNKGKRGGKIRVRAKIETVDKSTLIIKNIPYSTTTTSIIDSILKANDKGKIKIKKVSDNTAKDVEILIELPKGVSPDVTIAALYAFTDCEKSISPNACVIIDQKPHFVTVNEMLKVSTDHTVSLLKWELENRKSELEQKWHNASLEKIFIENRIYRDIEECETWEEVLKAIDDGLEPFKSKLNRAVTEEDLVRLTEIRIKRISKYDAFKADDTIKKLISELDEVKNYLANLTEYAIDYFKNLKKKYGNGRERRTEIMTFDEIKARRVAATNKKLYVNKKDGFIGTGLKKEEYVEECSDISDVIVFKKNGTFAVYRVGDKIFVGKGIIHVAVWKKGDDRMTYHLVYRDGNKGKAMIKRFNVSSVTREKEYDLTKGTPGTKLLYFSANPNAESEVIKIDLNEQASARNLEFTYDTADLAIKGRSSQGNTLTKYQVDKVSRKSVGESTIGGLEIWYDPTVGRLVTEERGKYLGSFNHGDAILVLNPDGTYEMTDFELTNRYNFEEVHIIEKHDPEKVITAVHYDGAKKTYYVKRFQIETQTLGNRFSYISDHKESKLAFVTTNWDPSVYFKEGKKTGTVEPDGMPFKIADLIDVKGWKAMGNRLSRYPVKFLKLIESEKPAPKPEVDPNDPNNSNDLKPGDEMEWDLNEDKKAADAKPKAPPPDLPSKGSGKPPKGDQGSLF